MIRIYRHSELIDVTHNRGKRDREHMPEFVSLLFLSVCLYLYEYVGWSTTGIWPTDERAHVTALSQSGGEI